MYGHKASHTVLITSWLLLVVIGSASAQSRKSGRQEPRGVNVIPAVSAPPTAERRAALVIGNSAYVEGPLANPVNDATDMANTLQQMGFASTLLRDADLRRMRDAIETFSKQLRPGVVGLFYFAGHGLQVKGENYLVPIGARIAREQDVEFETVHVGRVLGAMEAAENGVNIIILDACRNNPFARSFRSSQRGLAVPQAITGSMVAYATAPGSVAADGSGRNGVYTLHLLQNMRIPGLSIEQVFKNVRIDVIKETSGAQTPWESSSLTGNIAFIPSGQQEQGNAMTGKAIPLGSSPSVSDLQAQVEAQRQQVQTERQRLDEERLLREEQQKLQAEQARLRQEREQMQGGGSPQGTQVAVGIYPQQPTPSKGTIKIVTSWPMQGAMIPEGTTMKQAVDLAVKHHGGAVDGFKIEVVNRDDASPTTGSWDGTVEAEIAQKAAADPDVMVYLGTYNSGAAKVSMPITNKAGLVQISPANTYPGLTKKGWGTGEPDVYRSSGKVNYFRPFPADDIQGAAAAAWAKCLGFKKVYVLDDRQLYGKGIADVFVANARKLGLEIVGHTGIESVDVDFRALLTKVKASGADLVYGGFVIDSGGVQVLQQMKTLGLFDQKVKFMGPDGIYSPAMIEQATPAAVNGNVYVTFAALPPDKLPTDVGKRFYKDYLEAYRSEPIGWAMYAYQSAIVALDAIKRAGKKDRAAILEAVRQTKDFEGVTGKFSFDEHGDTNRTDMVGWAVKDGKFVYAESISAAMQCK